jgi:dolichol-phosphate mannosyltransferase
MTGAGAMSIALDPALVDHAGVGAGSMALVQPASGLMLSIVIPTFNEVGNMVELLGRIDTCLQGVGWEVIVVDDDSADGTADLVAALGACDSRIRCLRRVGRRGLSGACLEGMASAHGRYFAIMDADLQHDERLLPAMLQAISAGGVDLVVGSRYVAGGSVDAWSPMRHVMSRAATLLTRVLLKVGLSDPMSGFFMIRPEALRPMATRLSGSGFKLLLDLVASSAVPLRILELPYRFAVRQNGRSKLDGGVVWAFARLLAHQVLSRLRSRFGKFCLIGSSGVLVHFGVLLMLQGLVLASFPMAQTAAVIVSMISNFALNNRLTFADLRLRGTRFVGGLSRFAALCALGAVVNVVVAEILHHGGAPRLACAAAGIVAGAVCNYLTTSALVWRSLNARSQ